MDKVSIICKSIEHYRVDFFARLYQTLQDKQVCLQVITGEYQGDTEDMPWLIIIPNKSISIIGRELIWQPCLEHIKDSDLVIVEQANKLILNYYLLALRAFTKKKLAFWGHGRNFQSEKEFGLEEKIKSMVSRLPDWWFGYTRRSLDLLVRLGYPKDKITIVNNSIDTSRMKSKYSKIKDEEMVGLAQSLGINSKNIGIYIGALYKAKKIGFLIEACMQVKKQISDFELIIVGSGEDEGYVQDMSTKYSWIHYAGPVYGDEKLLYLKLAKVYLLPGVIGLAILDAFATETPPILIAQKGHGPEISYMQSGENGVLVEENSTSGQYADKLVQVLNDDPIYNKLVGGCCVSSQEYSLEKMVDNFAGGICLALDSQE